MAIIGAVFVYWLLALVCGFALGTLREFLLTPHVGPALATLIELPIILGVLWLGCRWIVARFRLALGLHRVAMGGLWFLAFLATEFVLGAVLRGWSPAETVAHFSTAPGALGLAGFTLAALFPLWAPQREGWT